VNSDIKPITYSLRYAFTLSGHNDCQQASHTSSTIPATPLDWILLRNVSVVSCAHTHTHTHARACARTHTIRLTIFATPCGTAWFLF